MVARNRVREQLLAEAKARRRAYGQKLARLRKAGVRIGEGGVTDIRRPMSELSAMDARQLRSQIRHYNEQIHRSVVPGYKGAPLSGSMWREYKRLEKRYNTASANFYGRIRDLDIPGIGMTVQERLAKLKEDGHRAGDYRSFGTLERTAAGITGQESLKTLLEQMRKRTDPRYLEREARLQRRILSKMLARTGNKDLIPAIKDLEDEEVITLAQYTGFMETLEGSYAMAKSTSADTPRWQSSVYEDNEEKIHDWTDWAHRHFTDKDDSEQDADDSRTRKTPKPGRDRFGRFARANESKPDPTFARDERGRFKPRGKFK